MGRSRQVDPLLAERKRRHKVVRCLVVELQRQVLSRSQQQRVGYLAVNQYHKAEACLALLVELVRRGQYLVRVQQVHKNNRTERV